MAMNPEELGEGPMKYENEDEEFLFGPTMRPDDNMKNAGKRKAKRPANLSRYTPMLTHMAESPDAPQELHDLLRILQYHTGGR